MKSMKNWELSLLIAVILTVLCCALQPNPVFHWWSTAFEPLCDGLATADSGGSAELVLRSRLWELLSALLRG